MPMHECLYISTQTTLYLNEMGNLEDFMDAEKRGKKTADDNGIKEE